MDNLMHGEAAPAPVTRGSRCFRRALGRQGKEWRGTVVEKNQAAEVKQLAKNLDRV